MGVATEMAAVEKASEDAGTPSSPMRSQHSRSSALNTFPSFPMERSFEMSVQDLGAVHYNAIRKNMRILLAFAVSTLLLTLGIVTYFRGPSTVVVSILHVNDHHGHLPSELLTLNRAVWLPLDLTIPQEADVKIDYGGLAMIAEVYDREQEVLERESPNSVVFRLHAGDALTGTAYYSLFKGEVDAKVMNQICFDAFALGNHEFDDGDANLAAFLDNLQDLTGSDCKVASPVLAANVVPGKSSPLQNKFKPWTILERGGIKLGLIGIDTRYKTMESSSPDEGTVLTDEAEAAQRSIDELERQGIKHIVILSHVGFEMDKDLAANLTGVDAIIGADSHSLLAGEKMKQVLNGHNHVGDYPLTIDKEGGGKVCIVQAYEYAHILGRLSLTFDREGKIQSCTGEPILPYLDVAPKWELNQVQKPLAGRDQEKVNTLLKSLPGFWEVAPTDATYLRVKKVIDDNSDEINRRKRETVVVAAHELVQQRMPKGSDEFAYQYGCAVSPHVAKSFLQSVHHACFAIINGGGTRSKVNRGNVTYNDAQTILPFEGKIVEINLTGQQVKDVLEDVLHRIHTDPSGDGSFPYASGLRFNVDMSQMKGNRADMIQTKCGDTWDDLISSEQYTLVSTSYLARGKDGYDVFLDAEKILETGLVDLERFLVYLRRLHANGETLGYVDQDELSLQKYVNRDGCHHTVNSTCSGLERMQEETRFVV